MKSFPFILKLSHGNFFIFNQGTRDPLRSNSGDGACTDSIPLCSSFMCTLMANVCRKTCHRCGDGSNNGQLSLIDEMFAGFDSVQIIGPAHAIPPKPIWTEGCPLNRQSMKKHYSGFEFNTTRAGIPCQRWDAQMPQSHNITKQSPDFEHFDANYCRNPDNDPDGAWCYTMDKGVRWDYCSNKNLPCDECHFENGNCPDDQACFDPDELTEGNVICGEMMEATTTTETTTTTTTTVKTISWAEIKPPKTCGERQRAGQRRIINGHNAVHGENAWMVALSTKNSITCGGSIITSEFVITAAHCVALSMPDELDLYAGVHDINALAVKDAPKEDLEHVQRRKTDSLFIHPQYSKFRDSSDDNDIALIKVIEPFKFTDYVTPICLPSTKATPDLWCEVTGWGDRKSRRPNLSGVTISDIFAELPAFAQFPFRRRREETAEKKQRKGKKEPLRHSRRGKNILQTAQLDIIDFDECEMIYYDALLTLTSNMFCAKSNNGADTLAGDSGGPLQCENERGDWTLYGITSWGLTGEEKYPGVYTSVVEYMPWIGNVLNNRIEPSDNSEEANRNGGRMGSPATIIEVWAPFPFFK